MSDIRDHAEGLSFHPGDEFAETAKRLHLALNEKWIELVLSGPKRVSDVATKLERMSYGYLSLLEALRAPIDEDDMQDYHSRHEYGDRRRELRYNLNEELIRFVEIAQAVLDDDGTQGNTS
ncbi:hypothetical protein ABTZ59_02610 [Streptomyces sp. NPDC094034]|uniref:hypothetical protein n=1 Tax=Streptomyces sp. NPDC094034 TaxID=3155309 RepID=UPI00331E3291